MNGKSSVRAAESRTIWSVVTLTGLALIVRVVALGHKGLWQDEVFSVLFARPSNANFWPILKTAEANMALYYVALRAWMHWFTGDAGVRMLSVIPGVLTIPVMYALGARLYSRRVGIWAAALMTINTCAVVYSQEARGYSLLVLFVALSYWTFLQMVERTSILHCLAYGVFTVCAFYSHFYAVFVVLAQMCSLLLLPSSKVSWKSLMASWVVFGIATIPGLRVALLSHGSNLWWVPRAGVLEIYRTLTFLAAESGKAVGAVLTVLLLVPVGLAIGGAWNSWHEDGRSWESFRSGFAVLGLLVPMIVTFVLSAWRPMFFHRFLIICLVPFVLLAAAGLEQLRDRRASFALAAAIVGLSGVATAMSYIKVREDWRGAAAFTASESETPVIFYLKDAAAPLAFYRERSGRPMISGQAIRLEQPPTEAQVAEWGRVYRRVWVVRFPAGAKDAVEPAIARTFGTHYKVCKRGEFKAISVSLFSADGCAVGN